MKFRYAIYLLHIFTLTSCESSYDNVSKRNRTERKEIESLGLDNQKVDDIYLTLGINSIQSIQFDYNENLFGKFFCNRAEYFVIKNPKNVIYSSNTKKITLYYLDGELSQAQYSVLADIIPLLIKDLGSFVIIGRDIKNRKIINAEHILKKLEGGWVLNDSLDNYEIKWTLKKTEIKYRVNKNKEYDKFIYVEKKSNYEKVLSEIQKYC